MKSKLYLICPLLPLAVGLAHAQINDTFDTIDSGWVTDRYDPAGFDSVSNPHGSGNVLQVSISENDSSANRPSGYGSTFYDYQGKQLATPFSGSFDLSIDLYVDSAGWSQLSGVSTGLWGIGEDASNVVSAYPIVQYRYVPNLVSAGFYAFDYINGGWTFLTAGEEDLWNNIKISFTVGVGPEYYINGVLVGSGPSDPDTTQLSGVIINTYNFGQDYTVLYDNLNLGAPAVPEPSTYALGGVCLMIATVAIRRRRTMS